MRMRNGECRDQIHWGPFGSFCFRREIRVRVEVGTEDGNQKKNGGGESLKKHDPEEGGKEWDLSVSTGHGFK